MQDTNLLKSLHFSCRDVMNATLTAHTLMSGSQAADKPMVYTEYREIITSFLTLLFDCLEDESGDKPASGK